MIIYFPQIILIISNYSSIGSSAVRHTDKMAENRSKSQEAADLLCRTEGILTQNSESKVKDVPRRMQGTLRRILDSLE
jgi:hypothetical protein